MSSLPPRILLVEDDLFYRTLLGRLIAQVCPQVRLTTVVDPAKALEALRSTPVHGPDRIRVVISDLDLKSAESGMDLWNHCSVHLPNTEFLLLSGLPLAAFLEMLGNSELVPVYLPKPIQVQKFCGVLSMLLTGDITIAS